MDDGTDLELRPYIFLIAIARLLRGPTLKQIKTYLHDKPGHLKYLEPCLMELVELGALKLENEKYHVSITGNAFLQDQMPDPARQWGYVRQTLMSFLKIDGSTIEGLAKRFGAKDDDTLFRQLINQFVSNGSLDHRDGRYYVSDHAKQHYKLDLH